MPHFKDWIEHRRSGDREVLGWMIPEGDGFVPVDRLGRRAAPAVDWLTAEETLDDLGIGYLADRFEFRLPDDRWLQVRITEISPHGIRLKRDDWGAPDVEGVEFSAPFPMDDSLRQKES